MADSIREQIIQALITLLGGITTTGGYETNIGNNVDRGVRGMLEDSDLPAIVVVTGTQSTNNGPIGKNTHNLEVEIFGEKTFMSSQTPEEQSDKMLADIVKRLGTDTNLGGLAVDITQHTLDSGESETKTDVINALVGVTIQYRTGHLDPYN
jgi:hypothetical protein